ncbi:hypothetical protein AMECASPLE_003375 [Ameca splendens]|uniref:Uncharacterized protein n=1 Tax=Ameca splendens TaxID=208324 RepID=A0ABV0Y9H4_9TELE
MVLDKSTSCRNSLNAKQKLEDFKCKRFKDNLKMFFKSLCTFISRPEQKKVLSAIIIKNSTFNILHQIQDKMCVHAGVQSSYVCTVVNSFLPALCLQKTTVHHFQSARILKIPSPPQNNNKKPAHQRRSMVASVCV